MNADVTGFHTCENATKTNPFEIIPLQNTRKENNWKTEEALARAAIALETERIKGSNPWFYDDDDDDDSWTLGWGSDMMKKRGVETIFTSHY